MSRSRAIEKQIEKIYKSVFDKIFTSTRISSAMKGSSSAIHEAVKKLSSSDKYKEFCKEFAAKLAKKGIHRHRALWKKYYDTAKRLHHIVLPNTYKEFELAIMKKAIAHNFKMIKTIPSYMMKIYEHKYTSTLIEQVAKGSIGRNAFIRELRKHGHKNAGVIARTETAKLQTAIDESRAKSLGSVAYIWSSSQDKRTRPSHKAMNKVVVFWRKDGEKPLLDNMRGNAGEFPNCRCNPLPIFDEVDLTSSSYKVYDYRRDKIINMSRLQLSKAMKNGQL